MNSKTLRWTSMTLRCGLEDAEVDFDDACCGLEDAELDFDDACCGLEDTEVDFYDAWIHVVDLLLRNPGYSTKISEIFNTTRIELSWDHFITVFTVWGWNTDWDYNDEISRFFI